MTFSTNLEGLKIKFCELFRNLKFLEKELFLDLGHCSKCTWCNKLVPRCKIENCLIWGRGVQISRKQFIVKKILIPQFYVKVH